MVHASTRRHSARRLQVRPLSQGATELHANTFAARAGRWSAQHRKAAIWGWIAFVVVAFVIGGAVGVKKPTDYIGPGESGRAEQLALDHFPKDASESVLIQAPKGGSVRDAGVRKAVGDTNAAVSSKPRVPTCNRRTRARTPARFPRTGAPSSSTSRSAATRTRPPARS